jgi:hypothetical protein
LKNRRAFAFDDLTILLGLDPTDPADQAHIAVLDDIWPAAEQ